MYSPNNLTSLRRSVESALAQANQMMGRGDYLRAEQTCSNALKQWRSACGPKAEESRMVCALGRCYEAQRKYEPAYQLYMEALPHLKGQAYDDVYTSLLYLNERMGSFTKKPDGFSGSF